MHDLWHVAALERQGGAGSALEVKVTLISYPETGMARTSTIWTTLATAPALGAQVLIALITKDQ